MTASTHPSGTDRIAEAVAELPIDEGLAPFVRIARFASERLGDAELVDDLVGHQLIGLDGAGGSQHQHADTSRS